MESNWSKLIKRMKRLENREKCAAANKRFGVSRGVTRGTLYRYFESSAPVLTFAKPRPTAKPPGVVRNQWATVHRDNEYEIKMKKIDIRKLLISCLATIPLWTSVCSGQTSRQILDRLLPVNNLKIAPKISLLQQYFPNLEIYSGGDSTIYYSEKYLPADSIVPDNLIALTQIIDGKNIFAVAFNATDSLLGFYRLQNEQWKEIGQRKPDFDVHMIDFEELNGKPCLEIVAGTHYNMNGNSWKECFVYFPKEDTIKFAGSFCTQYTVNLKDTTISEIYEGSWYMNPHKTLYKWCNDSLIVLRTAEIIVPQKYPSKNFGTLEYYKTNDYTQPLKLIFREKYNERNKKHQKYWDNFFETE